MKVLSKRRVVAEERFNVSAIISIPVSVDSVQQEILSAVPAIEEQEHEAHVTLIYAGGIPAHNVEKAVEIIKKEISGFKIDLTIGPCMTMQNKDNKTVVYLKADHPELEKLHFKLRKLLEPLGASFTYPEFKGHMTIGYIESEISEKSKKSLENLDISIPVTLTEKEIAISKKVGDDWVRLARYFSAV